MPSALRISGHLFWSSFTVFAKAHNEDGFKIEHCAGSGCTAFVRLATVGANATNATISSLGKNKTFTYRVCAYNGAGDSIYSNTATATTLR